MNRDVLDKWCERGILGLVLAILIFGPLAMGAVETPYFLVIQGLTLATLLLWCVRLWLNPRSQLLFPPVCWGVLAFAAYAIGRYFTADLEYVARQEVIRVVLYALLFFVIVNNLHRQEHAQWISFTLIFLALGISGYAIYQFATNSDKVWTLVKPYSHRGSGTYINPNHLAGFLEMILPLALAWTLVSRGKALMKVFTGYAALVILVGIAVTVSRGSWVSVALMLTVFFTVLLFHRTHRLPSIVFLVVLVGAGIYFLPRSELLTARLKELKVNDRFNSSARFELWEPALRLWRENVWFGIGPNHFNYRFRAVRPETEQFQPDRAHNDYLNTLTDWGIVGVTLVAATWALLAIGAIRTWRTVQKSRDFGEGRSNKFALVLGASLGLLAILIHSTVDFNLHIPANAILAVTLMALLTGSTRFSTDRYWFTARLGTKAIVTLLLLAGVAGLGWLGTRRATEYAWLRTAAQANDFPAKQQAFEHALAVEPTNFETTYARGESYRTQSLEGNADCIELARRAMTWFERGMKLNPFDGYNHLRYGMCLDWPLEKFAEAAPCFDRAVQLDPNGYYTVAHMGWHYFQTGDYAAARMWFERSLRLHGHDNLVAESYLKVATRRMLDAAAQSESPRLNPPRDDSALDRLLKEPWH